MHDTAIAWAEQHLGRVVTHAVPLVGGMTSTMLALHAESGVAAVLRLIDQEPWRTHGHDLVTRESTTQQTLLGRRCTVRPPRRARRHGDGSAVRVGVLATHGPGARRLLGRDGRRRLPATPGRRGMFDEPGQRVRLEEHLAWALT